MSKYIVHIDGTIENTETDETFANDPQLPEHIEYVAWCDAGGMPEVRTPPRTKRIAETDHEMARIGEDLIDVLVANGTIALTDLPAEAQAKLQERKDIRNGS